MPLSGLLAEYGFDGGWPSIFYIFGLIGVIWSIVFIWTVNECPSVCHRINDRERKYIMSSLWGTATVSSPPVPYKAIVFSMPFYAILLAHMGQNYGYETLMTELPTYMKQVLRYSLKAVRTIKNIPNFLVDLLIFFSERLFISAPLLGHVDLLDGHLVDCRLDDLFQ